MRGTHGDLTLFVLFEHLVGVAVVGGDDECVIVFLDYREKSCKCKVNCFDTDSRCIEIAGVSNHISVGIIATDEAVFTGFDCVDDLIGDFCRFHPRTLIERHFVGGDFFPNFECVAEFFGAVTVPEIRHVTVLLRFGNSVRLHAVIDEKFAERIFDLRRFDKESSWQM